MRINFHSLKFKMILSVAVLFSLFIAASMISNSVASQLIVKKTESLVTSTVEQTDRYLSFLFMKVRDSAFVLSTNTNIEALSKEEILDEVNSYERYRMVGNLLNDINSYYSNVSSEFDSVYVYIANTAMVLAPGFRVYRDVYINSAEESWMAFEQSEGAAYRWIGRFYDEKISGKNLISFVCRADKLNMDKVESKVNICVNFDEADIFGIIRNLKMTPGCMVYIHDSQGSIISSEDKNQIGASFVKTVGIHPGDVAENSLSRVKLQQGYYQAIYKSNLITGWRILLLIPESELLAENKAYWRNMLAIMLGMVAGLTFVAVKFIILSIDKPVTKLVKHMKELESGKLDREIREERKDEFGYLYKRYNEMVANMRNLILELKQENLLKREAQLKVLQSQINPHLLYNTLDTVNWIAKVNKVDKISQIVTALSNLYRTAFNKGMDYIKVEDLLLSTENYLYLQKLRYGDSFTYTVETDGKAGGYQVLNLILQPIVENAVIHGLGGKNQGGLLKVSAALEEDRIVFTVSDNGCGMNERKLKLVNEGLGYDGTISCDSGMRNVQKRIKLYYGEPYGIKLESGPAAGTTVTITVPAQRKHNEEDNRPERLEPDSLPKSEDSTAD